MGAPEDRIHSYSGSGWNGDVLDAPAITYELASALPTQVFKLFSDPSQTVVEYKRSLGEKEYELKDHLGNVKMVISDKKLVQDLATTGTIDGADLFLPQILTLQIIMLLDLQCRGEVLTVEVIVTGTMGRRMIRRLERRIMV